jgi:hypothetical protein
MRCAAGFILAVERQDTDTIVDLTDMVSIPDLCVGLTHLARLYAARLAQFADVTPEAFIEFTTKQLAGVAA